MVYIAAPLRHKDFNLKLAEAVENATQFAVAVPNRFQRPVRDIEEARAIAEYCYNLISFSLIVVVVRPIGLSTAAELGFLIAHKRSGRRMHIIAVNTEFGRNPPEDMLDPFIDYQAESIDQLVDIIKSIEKRMNPEELAALKHNRSLLDDDCR